MKHNKKEGDVSMGLCHRENFDHKEKLRDETSEATQRPQSKTKTLSTDRGSFKDKC